MTVLHAVHREPWHPDCPTCRAMTDPGIPELAFMAATGRRPKPRPLWRRLLARLVRR